MTKAWTMLILAGVFEIGWPLGLKLGASSNSAKALWILFSCVCMAISGYLLFQAQKTIPIGTAYAVWTGIGAIGTFFVGVIVFKDPASILKVLSIFLIAAGIVGLKLT